MIDRSMDISRFSTKIVYNTIRLCHKNISIEYAKYPVISLMHLPIFLGEYHISTRFSLEGFLLLKLSKNIFLR